MNTDTPDLTNLMEWNRFADEKKTLIEALTILNNRHRQAISELNQRLIRIEDGWREKLMEARAQIVAFRNALTNCDHHIECSWNTAINLPPGKCDCGKDDALSNSPPAVVPLEDVRPLVDAAENIRHWHDTSFNAETGKTEGIIVSANSFWKLKEALAAIKAKLLP